MTLSSAIWAFQDARETVSHIMCMGVHPTLKTHAEQLIPTQKGSHLHSNSNEPKDYTLIASTQIMNLRHPRYVDILFNPWE